MAEPLVDRGSSAVFAPGDPCLLLDSKHRTYYFVLASGQSFHYHRGDVPHDDIIGKLPGDRLQSTRGDAVLVLRPGYADYVLRMPRGAQVVYPKDSAQILMWADIAPGCRVLEAGTGSGALTMAVLRAVGPSGSVVTVDTRDDHQRHAKKRIEEFMGGEQTNLEFRVGDVAEMVESVRPDRIVLDVPEPWHTVEAAVDHLAPGGVFCAYLPTVPQTQELRSAMWRTKAFAGEMTFECLLREWNVAGRSVRPSHQMVGHTGFITVARRVTPPNALNE